MKKKQPKKHEQCMPKISNNTIQYIPQINLIEYIIGATIFIFVLCIYLHTLTPTIGLHDSGDMVTAAYVLGIPHPPGYPFYCLIGKLWMTILPFGNIGFRMNIFSAIAGALSVMIVYLIVLQLTKLTKVFKVSLWINQFSAVIAALMLAFSLVFWQQATIAEKYTLNAMFAALLIYLLMKMYEDVRKLYVFSFVFGLAFTHHFQSMFLIPGSIYIILSMKHIRHALKLPIIIRCIFLFLYPLILYLYLPIRASTQPDVNWGNPDNIERFIAHISAQEYRERYFSNQDIISRMLNHVSELFPEQFGWILLVVCILGACLLFIDNWRWGLFFLSVILVDILYSIHYTIPNIEDYYIPAFIICCIFSGYGFIRICLLFKRNYLSYLVISCFGLLVFIEYNSHYFYNNKHKYYFAWDYGRNILKPLKQDSILITKGDAIMFPLWYLQYVEQMRMDVICVFSPYLHKRWHVNQLQQRYPEIFGEKISSDDEKKLKTIMLKKILYQVHLGRACYTLMDSKIPDEFTLVPVGIFHQIVTDRNKEKIKEEVLNSMVEFNIRGLHDPKIYQSDWRTRQEIIWNYASGYNNYGFFYSIHNQTEKAIIAYKKAIEIKPEDVVFHINLAKTYLAVDMIQDAIREFRFAIQLSPENADLYNDLGSIYGRCRMYKEAINMFNKAKQYSPSDIKSYRNIASAYYQLGEYRLAKKECIEGLKLMPNDMYLQRMLKVLNRITKEG